MPQEKHPDMNGWRERLAELDNLPEEPVTNSAGSWNRIQSRLNVEKKAIPYYWYRVAAILVLVIATAPFIDFNNEKKDFSTERITHTVTPTTKSTATNNSSTTVSDRIAINKRPNNPKRNIRRTATTSRQDITPSMPTTNAIATDTPVGQNNEIQSLPTETTAQDAVVGTVPAKKLKVLHINEIQYDQKLTAASDRQRDIRVNERSSEDFSEAYAHNKAADHLIKIKLPSN